MMDLITKMDYFAGYVGGQPVYQDEDGCLISEAEAIAEAEHHNKFYANLMEQNNAVED